MRTIQKYLDDFKTICNLQDRSDEEILKDYSMLRALLHYIDTQIIIEKHNALYKQKILESKASPIQE